MTKPFAFALCALLVTSAQSLAGPLAPPVGPVAPSPGPEPRKAVNAANTPGGPIDQFQITQPGSYYLESNLSISPGISWGVAVLAPGVTLDLNGFTIDGNNLGSNGGIRLAAPGILIRNGTIRNVEFSGISSGLFPTGSPGMTVENVRVLDVSGGGIPPGGVIGSGTAGIFGGRGAIIRNCYVSNASIGIAAGFNANISGCTVENARQFGINIDGGAMVSHCVVVGTAGGPVDGDAFVLGLGSSVDNCVARSNTGAGFVDRGESAFNGCRASNNAGAGFRFTSQTRLDACHAAGNTGPGAVVTDGGDWEITRCSFLRNAGGGVILNGSAVRGRIDGCSIRGTDTSGSASIGVKVPSTCEDIIITNCTIAFVRRAVELDGGYCRVTTNAINFVNSGVAKSDGSAPQASNFVGPVLAPSEASTATNPFANTSQ